MQKSAPRRHDITDPRIQAKTVRKARKLIAKELPTGLDEWEKATLAEELEALLDAVDAFLTGMESM